MKTKLRMEHDLFQRLIHNPPQWWTNLKSDNEVYIDVRKGNSLNVYHNGGSIMKLEGARDYRATISYEYIPLGKMNEYMPYGFQDGAISFLEGKPIELNNFSKETLMRIKKRIKKFYPNDSEKGIQGNYVVKNHHSSGSRTGFFIDTEFQYDNGRIDMVWVDSTNQKIAFVELKTIDDHRLYIKENHENIQNKLETIDVQLGKYLEFIANNVDDLMRYYDMVYCIKKELGLLPEFVNDQSLANYELIEKPILLVGDCSQEWINNNAEVLNDHIRDIAFGSVYQGINSFRFSIPYKSSRNNYRLSEI
jgi:hypothetical protein